MSEEHISEHSPEPWRAEFESYDDGDGRWWIRDEQDVVLAHLYGFADIDDTEPLPIEANAALMAAAPTLKAKNERLRAEKVKLLEALEVIKGLWLLSDPAEVANQAMDVAQRAIATAEEIDKGGA